MRQTSPRYGRAGTRPAQRRRWAQPPEGKILITGPVEVQEKGAGRIRLSAIDNFSAGSLHGFLRTAVARGAAAKIDGWSGYAGTHGLSHDPHLVGKMAAHIVLPWVHGVFSNLKTWALGVYHGLRPKNIHQRLVHKHLDGIQQKRGFVR